MKLIIIKVIRITIILLSVLSLFYLFYEYDNYKRQYSNVIFLYKENRYEFSNATEQYNADIQSLSVIINRLEQLLYINLTIVLLVVIYYWLIRKAGQPLKEIKEDL